MAKKQPNRGSTGAGRPSSSARRPGADPRSAASARRSAAALRAAQPGRKRFGPWLIAAAVVVVAVAVIVAVVVSSSGSKSSGGSAAAGAATATLSGPPGPEGIVREQGALLAPLSTAATGPTVGGVRCEASEQVAYHIHTHLSVYVNGALRAVPAGIGVVQPVQQQTGHGGFDQASQCYYWLHTHAQDGIIHVEAPSTATYTLGQFFDIWRQPLTANQVAAARGTVTAYVNGVRYTGNPATIPLKSREDVQLDVGSPTVAPRKIDWSQSQL